MAVAHLGEVEGSCWYSEGVLAHLLEPRWTHQMASLDVPDYLLQGYRGSSELWSVAGAPVRDSLQIMGLRFRVLAIRSRFLRIVGVRFRGVRFRIKPSGLRDVDFLQHLQFLAGSRCRSGQGRWSPC